MENMKFKRKKVNIYWKDKPFEVLGYIAKNLIAHKIPTDETKHIWTISHLQTGFGVGLIYPPLSTLKQAKEIICELVKEDDWHIEGARFGEDAILPKKRTTDLRNIVVTTWFLKTGIQWVKPASSSHAKAKKVLRLPMCRKCGKDMPLGR